MIELRIPGLDVVHLEHLVLDFNGTLAQDGRLLEGVAKRVHALAERLEVHVVTADTYGRARDALDGLPVTIQLLKRGDEAGAKLNYARTLGPTRTAAVGNGANDGPLLAAVAVSVAVLGPEGVAREALLAARVLVRDPLEGLELFLQPKRLIATLRR